VNGATCANRRAGPADYCAAMRLRRATVTASIALLVLAGCGGGDDDDSVDTNAPTAGTAAGDSGATTTARPSGGGGLGMGPETFARQLIVALRADSYTVDGTTITMEFTDGSTADAEPQCTIASATVGGNASVILAYPDGEVPCE
jgi:hypothetical protein